MCVGCDSVGVFKDVVSVMYSSCYICVVYICCVMCLFSMKVTVLVSLWSSVHMNLLVQECWKATKEFGGLYGISRHPEHQANHLRYP